MKWFDYTFTYTASGYEFDGVLFATKEDIYKHEKFGKFIDELFKQSKPKLSLRRSCIIILHELYYEHDVYPNDLNMKGIYNRVQQRFKVMHRNKIVLESAQKIHPKNPCQEYGDRGHAKAQYRKALKKIFVNPDKYFQVINSIPSLKIIYQQVKEC